MKWLIRCFALIGFISLSACRNVPIAEDLGQSEANQIIALLAESGIYAYAERDSTGKPKYNVKVDSSFYIPAKTILVEKSLPKSDRATFVELVEARGLLPSSREMESLRLDHALALELEEALNSHPGVNRAKVIVRSRSVADAEKRAVSVIIEERGDRNLDQNEIINIISNSLPEIARESIALSVNKAHLSEGTFQSQGAINKDGKVLNIPLTHFVFNWRVPESDYNAMVVVLILCFLFVSLVGGLVGYWFGYFKNSKIVMDQNLPDLNLRSLRLDRPERGTTTEI